MGAADLVERTPVTVLLSVWGSEGPTVVARLSGSTFTEIDFRVGAQLPLTWGATGRVFLAFTPRKVSKPRLDKELRSLSQSRSPLAISRSELEAILDRVRRQGVETVIPLRLSSGMALEGHAAVAAPVRLHVAAKRYLCAVGPAYLAGLSPASQRSLKLQGGPFDPDGVRRFEEEPYGGAAVALRRWDDAAKVPGLAVPGLEHYRPRLEAALLQGEPG